MSWLIYKHTSVDTGKVYIGLTKHGMEYRWSQHCRDAVNPSKPANHFHNALCRYGVVNWLHEILVSGIASIEEAETIEKEFIAKYDSYNNGYNSTLGGSGVTNTSGKAHHFYGKKKSVESIEKGRKTRAEIRSKMTNDQKQEQQKNAIAGTRKHHNCKKYTFYNPTIDVTINGYVGDVAKQFKIHKAELNKVASGEREFWSGWYLKNKDNKYILPYPKYRFIHNKYNEELCTLVEMVNKYSLSKGNLHAVIQGKRAHCKGWAVDLASTVFYHTVNDKNIGVG